MAKFGFSQMSNPTPAGINLWVRVFTVSAGIFLLWMPTATFIGAAVQTNIGSILGLFVALANGLAPLFGVQVTSNDKVPAQNVTAMEDKVKP